MTFDPVRIELFHHRLGGIAEEMGAALQRSAFSPNIKERRDYSCALFDGGGRMVAQGENIPVHLGSMPDAVAAALREAPPGEGEMTLLNDPFRGGTHLPDLTVVAPVVLGGAGVAGSPASRFYVANRAHHADIGGMSAGSMPLSTEIFQEGLVIPPVRIVRQGEIDRDLLRLLLANVRTPEEREGDLRAQIAACRLGERRLQSLAARFGAGELDAQAQALAGYSERLMRETLAGLPAGVYAFADALDDDGAGSGPVPLRVEIRLRSGEAEVDFAGTAAQVPGPVNAVASITRSAVFYAFRCLAPDRVPNNHGAQAPIRVRVPAGSVLDAHSPAAVAGGNVETSQRVVDLVFGALASAAPGRIPAASQGTMNNLAFGGLDPRDGRPFAYYETIGGGCGAGPLRAGLAGTHSHMTNSWNTPIEALEHDLPVRVRRYALRPGSGGSGLHKGGDGIVREIEFQGAAEVTLLTERRHLAPWGLAGGEPGERGSNHRVRAGAAPEPLAGKCRLQVRAGDRVRVATPGGGGWGKPPPDDPSLP